MKYYAHTAVDPDGNPLKDEQLRRPLAIHLRSISKVVFDAIIIAPQEVRPSGALGALQQRANYDFNPRLTLPKGDNFKIHSRI